MESLLVCHGKGYIGVAVHPVCTKVEMPRCGLNATLQSLRCVHNANTLPLGSEGATNIIYVTSGCPPRQSFEMGISRQMMLVQSQVV